MNSPRYPFDPEIARHWLQQAGYPHGLSISLIATQHLEVQATVVSKMLEQSGFRVALTILDPVTYAKKTILSMLEQPPVQQTWDMALTTSSDGLNPLQGAIPRSLLRERSASCAC